MTACICIVIMDKKESRIFIIEKPREILAHQRKLFLGVDADLIAVREEK